MTEISFAKKLLSTLGSRPVKLQPDYVADPITLEPKGPYTLPRMPHPMRQPTPSSVPGSEPTINILLKSLRNPPLSLSLSSQSPTTSIHELKAVVAKELAAQGLGTENIRILYKKKPCSDSRTVKEVVGLEDLAKEVEFSVMLIGGATAVSHQERDSKSAEQGKGPVAQGPSGDKVLQSDEFWEDLKGFLVQRVRNEGKAVEAWEVFRDGWRKRIGM